MTTAPAVDERLHRDAVKAALGHSVETFDFGEVPGVDGNPGEAPSPHWIIGLERRPVAPQRAGRTGLSSWRLIVVGAGSTPDEARWALLEAATALEEARLTVDGTESTPLMVETAQAVDRGKDGWWSGRVVYTYTC